MSLAERAELVARLSLRDEFSGKLRGVVGSMQGLDKATSNTQRALGRFGHNLEVAAVGGATAFAGAVVGSIKVAGDFEASLNTINTIARAQPAALNAIGDAIRKVARDTGTPLEELTTGYYDLLSAGVKAADATNVLTAANKLAIGGLATTAQTVDLLTTAINAYGGNASKAGEYADDFAKAIELGKVTADQIAASFANVGSIAATSGIKLREIAAAYGYLTAQGVPAAEVTTQMSRAIVELLKPSASLEKLQKKLGVSFAEVAKKKGLVVALQEMRDAADKAHIPFIELFGRVEAYKFALQTTGDKNAGFNDVLRQMGDDAGTAAAQMAERQQGLNFQLARLKALAKDAGITIGSALLPKLTPLVERLNTFISNHPEKIAAIGDSLARAFDSLAGTASKIDWSAIGGGLEITGRAARGIVDAFLALPPDLQKLVVAAIAINKVGGGIIGAGIKDIGGFLLKNLTTVNAVNVNVIGRNVVGGGGVAGGAGGGGIAGKIGTALSVATAATAIAAAVQTYFSVNESSSAQASDIKKSLEASIAQGASLADLQTSLLAIDTGISQIRANPLFVLVQGDALTKLDQMRQETVAAIGRATGTLNNADRWWSETAVSTSRTSDKVEAMRSALVAKQDAANASLQKIADKREENRIQVLARIPINIRVSGAGAEAGATVYRGIITRDGAPIAF